MGNTQTLGASVSMPPAKKLKYRVSEMTFVRESSWYPEHGFTVDFTLSDCLPTEQVKKLPNRGRPFDQLYFGT